MRKKKKVAQKRKNSLLSWLLRQKSLNLFGLLILIIGLPVIVILGQQKTQSRQFAATFGGCGSTGQYVCSDTCKASQVIYTDSPPSSSSNNACTQFVKSTNKQVFCCNS